MMEQNQKVKSSTKRFVLGMIIYAAVFLLLLVIGLGIFWNYMAAYENSRPKHAINAYMDSLTQDHVVDLSQNLIDQVDHNIQTQQQCREFMKNAIGKITYAKKSKESNDMRQTFVLRSGTTVIGQFSIIAQEPDKYGFTVWELGEESFDISGLNLFGSDYSVTVPSDHVVTVNGYALDDSYITNEKVVYEEIEEFYGDYELAYRVSYAVAPIMGEMDVVITDPDGKEVTFDENTDWTPYFHNCTEDEANALDAFTKVFVERYVAFTGSRRSNRYTNFNKLINHVHADSELRTRLANAVEGLEYGQSQGDKIVSLVTRHQVRLNKDHYLCDFTYEVDTTGRKGVVRTTTNVKLVVVQTENGLKAESMNIY